MQITNTGDAPILSIQVGGSFTIPGLGEVTCTNITVNDEYSDGGLHIWNVTYEHKSSSSTDDSSSEQTSSGTSSMPDDELSISYEINGSTVHTVKGEVIALRRSEKPIMKKSITKYTDSAKLLTTPGNTYQGGIVLSESIVQETIKNDNVVVKTYYKHTIEIEGENDNTSSSKEGSDGV